MANKIVKIGKKLDKKEIEETLNDKVGYAASIGISFADSLSKLKNYANARKYYNRTFKKSDWAYLPDIYAAVCAWAMAYQADSAFFHLFELKNALNMTRYPRLKMTVLFETYTQMEDGKSSQNEYVTIK